MTRNHRIHTGPNSTDTRAVPRACIRNKPIRITMVMPMIVSSSNIAPAPGMVRNPSMADSTDKAGVMIASP